jgi:hypothetical protein
MFLSHVTENVKIQNVTIFVQLYIANASLLFGRYYVKCGFLECFLCNLGGKIFGKKKFCSLKIVFQELLLGGRSSHFTEKQLGIFRGQFKV